jgi:hypothetical protein
MWAIEVLPLLFGCEIENGSKCRNEVRSEKGCNVQYLYRGSSNKSAQLSSAQLTYDEEGHNGGVR